jgi:hypothetical protein
MITRSVLTARSLAVARSWVKLSPPIRDVLRWHRSLCPVCVKWPVVCAEYNEITADYQITPLLETSTL